MKYMSKVVIHLGVYFIVLWCVYWCLIGQIMEGQDINRHERHNGPGRESQGENTGESRDKNTGESRDRNIGESQDKNIGDGQDKHTEKTQDKNREESEDKNNETSALLENRLTPAQQMLGGVAVQYKVGVADCREAFSRQFDFNEVNLLNSKLSGSYLGNKFYKQATKNCSYFIQSRGYITHHLSEDERNFPIAYSILVFKNAEMAERLLRAIYRPQNYYCIHVDKKSPRPFYEAMVGIAGCFSNVFLTARRVDVRWGTYSVLEPELLCMQELWRFRSWRYFINLTGQEFPLRTNYELVKILRALNGSNDVTGSLKHNFTKRWRGTKPPHGIRPVKGSVHITVNRHFVDYILHNETARDLLNWTRHTDLPDETFFATLNFNPQLGIRGTFNGDPETRSYISRYKIWYSNTARCAWRFVRRVCVLTTGDLPLLEHSKHLFANKFYLHTDRLVIGCLEEKLFNTSRDQALGLLEFDAGYYRRLQSVISQVV
ncbi:beta-1,3-galactosyl-O-glycosyl-glycoprotein beta-1,6-N-acetylglucosaminyltransferase-like [Physella acuta]|uniref:beta-1,3-galactosyl-O-glycosyl-glycoprotein beta-1,6-N-acetylglucosaminyltransferase-like n=1 Tax=Physella acuta TaxID=109671 RepID=UPI0027DCBC96|nr:beta-1,3-galactosyl-O-glycosyl-glycoprotein beta-1,6-N-acetylglucosaminyltransferase-like [Physella acuta]